MPLLQRYSGRNFFVSESTSEAVLILQLSFLLSNTVFLGVVDSLKPTLNICLIVSLAPLGRTLYYV